MLGVGDSEDKFMESVFSSCLFMGSEGWIHISRLAQQVPLPAKSFSPASYYSARGRKQWRDGLGRRKIWAMLKPDSGRLRVIAAPTHVLMGPGATSSDIPQAPCRFLFLRQCLSPAWNLPRRLCQLANEPQGSVCLCCPSTAITSMCHRSWI